MNKFLIGSALAGLALAAPGMAQNVPAGVVAVVDTDRIIATCTACVAANSQLQGQIQQLQQRAQALGGPLQTEEQALQAAVNALPQGQQPNAALQARIQAYQTSQANAQRELSGRQEQMQRNIGFVRQQIGQRIQPAIVTVMQQRGANIVVDRGATLAHSPTVEITDAVLAIVNQNTAAFNITAPPPQQQQPQPAQQPVTTPQPNRPRPTGR
jgi:outer membrane protein